LSISVAATEAATRGGRPPSTTHDTATPGPVADRHAIGESVLVHSSAIEAALIAELTELIAARRDPLAHASASGSAAHWSTLAAKPLQHLSSQAGGSAWRG
jgi:hypothetical protein